MLITIGSIVLAFRDTVLFGGAVIVEICRQFFIFSVEHSAKDKTTPNPSPLHFSSLSRAKSPSAITSQDGNPLVATTQIARRCGRDIGSILALFRPLLTAQANAARPEVEIQVARSTAATVSAKETILCGGGDRREKTVDQRSVE